MGAVSFRCQLCDLDYAPPPRHHISNMSHQERERKIKRQQSVMSSKQKEYGYVGVVVAEGCTVAGDGWHVGTQGRRVEICPTCQTENPVNCYQCKSKSCKMKHEGGWLIREKAFKLMRGGFAEGSKPPEISIDRGRTTFDEERIRAQNVNKPCCSIL